MYKIAQSHTCQKWPAIESEWGRMKVRETTSVQENVVLANIKALDLCVCGCMYTHTHTHTHTHTSMHTNYCEYYTYFILPWTVCNMLLWIWYYNSFSLSLSLSLSHTHTHTHTHTRSNCLVFGLHWLQNNIFFPSFDQNVTSTSAGSSKSEDCSTSVVARFSACSVMFSSSNISWINLK